MKRTSLLAFAAVAALGMAASSAAEAYVCPFSKGYSARAFSRVPQQRKLVKKPTEPARYSNATALAAKPVRPIGASKPSNLAKASPPVSAAGAANATSATTVEEKTITRSASTVAAATVNKCLSKEYLESGAVKFKDTCHNEWAINSTKVTTKTPAVGGACLTKQTNSNGVVLFRDVCTNEWAMNTAEQMAIAEAK